MAIDINIPSQVKNYANLAGFPATGSLKTIYIAEDTNKTYRWTGSAYVEISASGSVSGFVPYTGATGNVDLGTHTLSAKNLIVNHPSGSGDAVSITKGGAGEALTVVKTSGSGNAMSVTGTLGVNGTTLISSGLGAVATTAISVTGSSSTLFSVRGFGDALISSTLFLGAYSGNNFISAGGLGITSNQGTGNQFIRFTHNNSNNAFRILSNSNIELNPVAGNVLIGTTTDAGFKLDVNGTARFQNTVSIKNPYVSGGAITSFSATFNDDSNAIQVLQGAVKRVALGNSGGDVLLQATMSSNITGTTRAYGLDTFGFRVQGNGQTSFRDDSTNAFVNASCILELVSTTKGFLPPRMTTVQKNAIASPATGLVIYDTTLNKLCVRGASTWETITSL
jgi:hypothetical protein